MTRCCSRNSERILNSYSAAHWLRMHQNLYTLAAGNFCASRTPWAATESRITESARRIKERRFIRHPSSACSVTSAALSGSAGREASPPGTTRPVSPGRRIAVRTRRCQAGQDSRDREFRSFESRPPSDPAISRRARHRPAVCPAAGHAGGAGENFA